MDLSEVKVRVNLGEKRESEKLGNRDGAKQRPNFNGFPAIYIEHSPRDLLI